MESAQFLSEHVWRQKPVVKRGCAKGYPAVTRWTDEFLRGLDINRSSSMNLGEEEAKWSVFPDFLNGYCESDHYFVCRIDDIMLTSKPDMPQLLADLLFPPSLVNSEGIVRCMTTRIKALTRHAHCRMLSLNQ